MPLPIQYDLWPQPAKDGYQEMKRLAGMIRDYATITDAQMLAINYHCLLAVELDTGDGSHFRRIGQVIKDKYLTQTFH